MRRPDTAPALLDILDLSAIEDVRWILLHCRPDGLLPVDLHVANHVRGAAGRIAVAAVLRQRYLLKKGG